ncbi:hypothetical protein, partial [Frankia sp. EI5c]|uniref:hypothetical protein n=1 Tax=Frankia sp. EI5c TaxID=683316 RepID=UPI001A7EBB1D
MISSVRRAGPETPGLVKVSPADVALDQRMYAAVHECGHTVMRYLLNLPVTAVHIDEDGGGLNEGTGKMIRASDMNKISLAGSVAEFIHAGITDRSPFEAEQSRYLVDCPEDDGDDGYSDHGSVVRALMTMYPPTLHDHIPDMITGEAAFVRLLLSDP